MRINILLLFCCFQLFLKAQSPTDALVKLEAAVVQLDQQKADLLEKIETTKLAILHNQLIANGLPAINAGEEIIHHSAMSLVYSENHGQAKWVAHIISPDIINGAVGRSNDFREDPKVKTGTAIEEDFFLKYPNKEGKFDYDGFGWDRGHLAPSADFRWSKKGLSETYYYSNMTPQVPDFNRDSWATVENLLRAYVYAQKVPLYVVTGGVLTDDLPVIERSIHKVAIPKFYWKVAIDLEHKKGIAFLMPNKPVDYPTEHFATSIDDIERLTGIDFYASLPDGEEAILEQQIHPKDWIIDVAIGDVAPLDFSKMPKGHFNTIVGKRQAGNNRAVHICGKVVRTRKTRKGNVMFNLDKAYPNEIFNVFINKDQLLHFPIDPVAAYLNEEICAFGEVGKIGMTPTVFIDSAKKIKNYSQL